MPTNSAALSAHPSIKRRCSRTRLPYGFTLATEPCVRARLETLQNWLVGMAVGDPLGETIATTGPFQSPPRGSSEKTMGFIARLPLDTVRDARLKNDCTASLSPCSKVQPLKSILQLQHSLHPRPFSIAPLTIRVRRPSTLHATNSVVAGTASTCGGA